MIDEIEKYVKNEFRKLTKKQKATLEALLFAGYKGEREQVLVKLLKLMKINKIEESTLIESFILANKTEKVKYYRIKPEYYRSVRKLLGKKEEKEYY